MTNLETVVARLERDRVVGELWVDGSFLTQKIDPSDVDVLLRVEESFYSSADPVQKAAMDWFEGNLRVSLLCHSFFLPEGSTGESEWKRAYWIKQFGFSRTDQLKGMPRISITAGGNP
jgi:hypothetical protein